VLTFKLFVMLKHRGPYRQEFRPQLVEFVCAGGTSHSLAKEFEASAQTIRDWGRKSTATADGATGL